ncbi:MAG: thiol-disulfide oxidoreductase DCC family protein [Planctomycetota bacterium]
MARRRTPPVLVLYDGACGLCQRSVRFLLARDRRDALRFAALEGPVGQAVLARHPTADVGADSLRTVLDHGQPGERLLVRSSAALAALAALGGAWRLVRMLEAVPRRWRDAVYDAVAARRHRWFPADACALPTPRDRHKLLDLPPGIQGDGEGLRSADAPGPGSVRQEALR